MIIHVVKSHNLKLPDCIHIHDVHPQLIANSLESVKPLAGPQGLYFALRRIYGDTFSGKVLGRHVKIKIIF